MSPLRLILLSLVAWTLSACTMLATTPPPSPAEQEARAVFAELVTAARAKNLKQFKSLIAPADLREMEQLEREKPGFFSMFMGLVADGGDPSGYQAQVQGDQVRFVRRVSEKTTDMSSTETTTVTMFRQGGRWWFGKPRP